MAKAVPALLFIAFTCLFALCGALPSAVLRQGQSVSAQAKRADVPRTLLGKLYGRRWETTQPCPPPPVTVDPADSKDTDADRSTSSDLGDASRNKGQNGKDENDTARAPLLLPLPLIVNSGLESGSMRLGLTWSKRPMRCSRYSDDVSQRGSEDMMPGDEYAQRVHGESPVAFTPDGKKLEPRDVSMPVRRSMREEGKKLRLSAGYYMDEMSKHRNEGQTALIGSLGLGAGVGI